MKNSVQSGEVITVTAPYDVVSGAGVKVGNIFGIAASAKLSGATDLEIKMEGVYDILAVTADTATGGTATKCYWDDTAKKITTTVGSNMFVGSIIAVKTASDTTARVRLNGVSV